MQIAFTGLSDFLREVIEKFFVRYRPRFHSLRAMLNAILWLTRTGTQWRNLKSRYPSGNVFTPGYRSWKANGLTDQVCAYLVECEREGQGAQAAPNMVAIDRSINSSPESYAPPRG